MKQSDDHYTDEWLDKLDTIVAGRHTPTAGDDELLHVAVRLSQALAPLRAMDSAAEIRAQRSLSRLRVRYSNLIYKPMQRVSRSWPRVAVLLFILIIGTMSTGGLAALENGVMQVWQASTSLDQLKGISVASLARPHAGLKPLPLVPTMLPTDTQASSYGVITDIANPNLLTTFVADYHIAGQDVLLYEQPSYGPFSSSTARTVHIGSIEEQWFQDEAGHNALQWFQHGMVCQITSKLSVERLVMLASTFQPLKNWELLR